MALRFIDGFEYLATADLGEKYESTNAVTVSASYARTGSNSLSGTYGSWLAKAIAASGSVAIVGVGFRINTANLYDASIVINRGGANSSGYAQVTLNIYAATGVLELRRGSYSGTVLAKSSFGVIRTGVFNYIEWKTTINDSTGAYEVRVNGQTVLSGSSVDTQNVAGDATWDNVELRLMYNYFDDLYVCDGSGGVNDDFLGQCRVVTLRPSTGNGSNTDFTCSTGSDHGALVDEAAPNDDTDYVSSGTVDHVDTWNFPAVGYTGTVKGVQLALSAKKTDSGTRAIAAVTRPVSTNRVHATTHYLSTGYLYWLSLWEVNPEDSAAWEVADVDGAEFGAKVAV